MSTIKKLKLGPLRLTWVLRHIWEEDRDITNYTVWSMRKRPEFGIWFDREKAVGPVKKGKDKSETVNKTFNKSNHVKLYIIGLKLFVCHTWIKIQFKPTLGLK
jgi:hypothetical protein